MHIEPSKLHVLQHLIKKTSEEDLRYLGLGDEGLADS